MWGVTPCSSVETECFNTVACECFHELAGCQ
ncbi:hypothetical protein Rrhod_3146 [Rhodococcus rhodnii LMG 5362]|uniref:Uncharacterized protein n=1 Tax=Rhodococcus rhodnii LMG 5362 TaxID=1273125 RepID=R7WJA2_9NOCA|nr:hypothetical protein Rrhod_3146 [Rhodococcus rhodnii LMG 5362]